MSNGWTKWEPSRGTAYYRTVVAGNVLSRLLEARLASRLDAHKEVQAPPLTQEDMAALADTAWAMADEMVKARDRAKCCKTCGTEKF